jgi:pimeloyl-ACP methyl ester carboxylesterase
MTDSSLPQFIDVGGRSLFITCSGIGKPTVVLEAGAGENHTTWELIQSAVSQFTHVCSYDRAGLGQSEYALRPRTAQDLVDDLRRLVIAAHIPGPYVLVGHSLGGMIVRLYTHQFPAEVVGVVLIDTPHPDQSRHFWAAVSNEVVQENKSVREWLVISQGMDPRDHPEGIDWASSQVQVGAARTLGSKPLVVLTHRAPEDGSVFLDEQSDLPEDVAWSLERAWQDLQADLARLSSNSTHIIARKSGHYIHRDEPELVIEAIRQVVERVT